MKNNKKLSMAQKAKNAGLPAQTVYNRLFHGWSEKKALSVPVRKKAKPRFQLKGLTTKPPKKTAPYKVEPKKEQAVGSRVKPIIPLPVEKFEYPKDNMLVYVVVVAVIVVIVAMMAT